MLIKAIETRYKGYRFRSRLEARWAVFFDALDIDWEYEKEGFDLGEVGWCLPDFWLPKLDMWVEINPREGSKDLEAIEKCHLLSVAVQQAVLLIAGNPGSSDDIWPDHEMTVFGGMPWDMFLKDLPFSHDDIFERTFMEGSRLYESLRQFLLIKVKENEYLFEKDIVGLNCNILDEKARRKAITELDWLYFRRKHGKEHPRRMRKARGYFSYRDRRKAFFLADYDSSFYADLHPKVREAQERARSARFEHGEEG